MTTTCVSLEEAKAFLRIDHDEEDGVLQMMLHAATELVETRLRRKVVDAEDPSAVAKTLEEVPASIKFAVCVVASFMYENREATDEELRSRVLRQAALDRFILWGDDDA